jgi:hypothetical protein
MSNRDPTDANWFPLTIDAPRTAAGIVLGDLPLFIGRPYSFSFFYPCFYLCHDALACWLIGKVQFCICPPELAQPLERVDRGISSFAVVLVVTYVRDPKFLHWLSPSAP